MPHPGLKAGATHEPINNRKDALAMDETRVGERRVLVVDDEPAVRALVAASLDGSGCEVEAFEDGPSALQSALDAPPQLILLDVALPGMNGADVLRRLRAEPAT